MDKEIKEKRIIFIKKLIISLGIALVIFGLVFYISLSNGVRSYLHYIVNALFVAGVLLTASGVLSAIKKDGFFDIMQFGFKQFGETIKYSLTMKRDTKIDTDLIGFKEKKRTQREINWASLIVGLVFLIFSFVFVLFV